MALRKCGLFTAALICFVLSACQPTSTLGEKAAAPDPAPINALREQFVAAFNAGNAAEVANVYTDDAILMLPYEPAFEGKQAIQAAFEALFQNNADNTLKLTMTAQEIQIAGDWAYERGASSMTVTPKAGGKPIEDSRKYLVIFKRLPGGTWKAHRDTDSSNYPLPEPPGPKKN